MKRQKYYYVLFLILFLSCNDLKKSNSTPEGTDVVVQIKLNDLKYFSSFNLVSRKLFNEAGLKRKTGFYNTENGEVSFKGSKGSEIQFKSLVPNSNKVDFEIQNTSGNCLKKYSGSYHILDSLVFFKRKIGVEYIDVIVCNNELKPKIIFRSRNFIDIKNWLVTNVIGVFDGEYFYLKSEHENFVNNHTNISILVRDYIYRLPNIKTGEKLDMGKYKCFSDLPEYYNFLIPNLVSLKPYFPKIK